MMSTAAVCGVTMYLVAILVTVFDPVTDGSQKASMALIILWQAGFGVQSPLIWITTAESAPTRNRERVQAVAVFLGFGVSLLVTSVAPFIQNPGYGNLGSKIVSNFLLKPHPLLLSAFVSQHYDPLSYHG